jgi:hypothetical protein
VDIDEVTIAAPPPAEPSFSQECLDKCLAELSDENRTLVLDYFPKLGRRRFNSIGESQRP